MGLLRVVDRGIALILLAALSPLVFGLACALRLLSRRSPLVAHRRVGREGVPFWMLKFRTMWAQSPRAMPEGGWVQCVESSSTEGKRKADPRVTSAFAGWLRVHSLDELPQLWHVVRGEMSLVGPRPLIAEEIRKHYRADGRLLLSVPPGITGLWQTMGRNRLTYPQRRRLDLFLVRHYRWKLYFRVLVKTLPRMISGAGAW